MAMFCSKCGTKLIENALFCHKCGTQSPGPGPSGSTSSSNVTASGGTCTIVKPKGLAAGTGPPILTYEEFRGRKETERRGHFTNKSKKRKTEEKAPQEKLANVKIGTMTYREELGELKIIRGGNHTVSVLPSVGVKELLVRAVDKHSRFNRSLSNRVDEYYLLYPDKTRVGKLPGCEEDFTLQRYKQELGKPYERITLYLCKVTDFYGNMTNELAASELNSDSDSQVN